MPSTIPQHECIITFYFSICQFFPLFDHYECCKHSYTSFYIGVSFLFLLGIYLQMELLGHIMFKLMRICRTLLQWFYHFRFSPAMCKHSDFSLASLTRVTFCHVHYGHASVCKMSQKIMILICISLVVNDIKNLSMCLLVICVSLEKHPFRSFDHF